MHFWWLIFRNYIQNTLWPLSCSCFFGFFFQKTVNHEFLEMYVNSFSVFSRMIEICFGNSGGGALWWNGSVPCLCGSSEVSPSTCIKRCQIFLKGRQSLPLSALKKVFVVVVLHTHIKMQPRIFSGEQSFSVCHYIHSIPFIYLFYSKVFYVISVVSNTFYTLENTFYCLEISNTNKLGLPKGLHQWLSSWFFIDLYEVIYYKLVPLLYSCTAHVFKGLIELCFVWRIYLIL